MRIVIQRVNRATVTVDGEIVGHINNGLLCLVGVTVDDEPADADWLATKIVAMRLFDDEAGVMNLDVRQARGEVMMVSQFTLHAMTRKGNRPSYIRAARPEVAQPLYDYMCSKTEELLGTSVARGVFGAHMMIDMKADGPVTIIIDSKNRE